MVSDYGDCVPGCPVCGGMGLISEGGKLVVCPNKRRQIYDERIGITEAEASMLNLDSLQPTSQLIKIMPYLRLLLAKGTGWLYVEGKPGVGKTTFLKAVVLQYRYRYDGDGQYVVHSEVIDRLRSSFGRDALQGEFEKRMAHYYNKPFLAIDEIGRDTDTDFSEKSFSKILDHRYNMALAGKQITVFASNFASSDIFQAYVADRIMDHRFQYLKLDGPSARRSIQTQPPEPGWWQNLTAQSLKGA